jgi:hypothetical protein
MEKDMPGAEQRKFIPIYTTSGEWRAILCYPHIFNTGGEWVGWVTPQRQVYDVDGVYVGWLTNTPRILCRRADGQNRLRREAPPPPPDKIRPPAHVPLPPMMAELPFQHIDVLESLPDRLHTRDHGEFKPDMR